MPGLRNFPLAAMASTSDFSLGAPSSAAAATAAATAPSAAGNPYLTGALNAPSYNPQLLQLAQQLQAQQLLSRQHQLLQSNPSSLLPDSMTNESILQSLSSNQTAPFDQSLIPLILQQQGLPQHESALNMALQQAARNVSSHSQSAAPLLPTASTHPLQASLVARASAPSSLHEMGGSFLTQGQARQFLGAEAQLASTEGKLMANVAPAGSQISFLGQNSKGQRDGNEPDDSRAHKKKAGVSLKSPPLLPPLPAHSGDNDGNSAKVPHSQKQRASGSQVSRQRGASPSLRRPTRREHFPERLYRLLMDAEKPEMSDLREVVRFSECGTKIEIYDPGAFETTVIPRYFRHGRLCSFKRQLNLYGFQRLHPKNKKPLVFSHPDFGRTKPESCLLMDRVNVSRGRATSSESA